MCAPGVAGGSGRSSTRRSSYRLMPSAADRIEVRTPGKHDPVHTLDELIDVGEGRQDHGHPSGGGYRPRVGQTEGQRGLAWLAVCGQRHLLLAMQLGRRDRRTTRPILGSFRNKRSDRMV